MQDFSERLAILQESFRNRFGLELEPTQIESAIAAKLDDHMQEHIEAHLGTLTVPGLQAIKAELSKPVVVESKPDPLAYLDAMAAQGRAAAIVEASKPSLPLTPHKASGNAKVAKKPSKAR
mgnify:CR=1 FL=1